MAITQLRCFLGLNLPHSTGEGKNTQGFRNDQILKITAEETHWRKEENWQTTSLGFLDSFLMKIKHGQHSFWFPRPGYLGNSRPLNAFSKRKWPLAIPWEVQVGFLGEFLPWKGGWALEGAAREGMESPSLEVLKKNLDMALCYGLRGKGVFGQRLDLILEVFSSLKSSMNL